MGLGTVAGMISNQSTCSSAFGKPIWWYVFVLQTYLIELLIIGNCQQDVSGGYPGLLVVPRGIPSQL